MTQENKVFISVIIPAYNEEARIVATFRKIKSYLNRQNYSHEIIIVDDGSDDRTGELVKGLIKNDNQISYLRNLRNMGKGYSVKCGVLKARGDYIMFSDADLSVPIEEIEKLFKWLREGFHIAIGSRGLPESKIIVRQFWVRQVMGKIFNFLIRRIAVRDIRDTQCGFKCFKKGVADRLFQNQKLNGFSFDVEILYLAQKAGYRIKEVPIVWSNSTGTKVHIIKDAIKMFFDLIRIIFFHRE